MKKLVFMLMGLLVLILALGAVSLWQAPDLSNPKSLETLLPGLQKIYSPNDESAAEDQYQEFASPDAKFKIEYPSNWTSVAEDGLLQALAPQEWAEKYELKALFLAQSFQEGKFAQMVIYKGTFEIPIEEIFEKMKETNENNGWTVEVLKSETDANMGIFEGRYRNRAGSSLHSEEKILISGKEGYLVSLFALENDWQGLQEIIDKIINSAKI